MEWPLYTVTAFSELGSNKPLVVRYLGKEQALAGAAIIKSQGRMVNITAPDGSTIELDPNLT